MNYTEFVERIVSMVGEDMGSGFTVSVQQVTRRNNTAKDALVIRKKDKKENIIPLVYLEPYFKIYRQGESMEECVMRIGIEYLKNAADENMAEEVKDTAFNWRKVKRHVYPFLISREANRELLKDLVYKEFLDLAVCYMVRFDGTDKRGSLSISNTLLRSWGVSREELHLYALVNMNKDGYRVTGMEELISELDPEHAEQKEPVNQECMYIVTNEDKMYGAAGILLDASFLTCRFGMKNFYILPSSIHEIILVPDGDAWTAEELSRMVRDVNREQVDPEERLSDHVYYYDWDKREIQIVK